MLQSKLLVATLAIGLLGATTAFAETAGPDQHKRHEWAGRSDFAAWQKDMCADRYARHVGNIAYLETKLALSDSQRPLFETWKTAVLGAAKSREDACMVQMPDIGHPPTILDRKAQERIMLQARLAALDAEQPALQSLYQALTPDQKTAFDMPGWRPDGSERRHGDGAHEHEPHEDGPNGGRNG